MPGGDVENSNIDYKELYESLRGEYDRVSFELKNIMRIDNVLDSTLEQMVNRENISDILNDIAGIFMYTSDFGRSEINVFAHSVRDFVGMGYAEFSKKRLSEIIDSSVSKFSKGELARLENDIKQTSYLLINGEGRVYVSNANDVVQLRKVFSPVYGSRSAEDFDREISEKVSKTTSFGIRSHLSVLLHSYKVDEGGRRKIPIGYFHLTKKNEFSDFDFWLVNRIVNHSAVVIDNYFNLRKKEALLAQVNDMVEADVARASRIVKSLVPERLPLIDGFDLASYYRPAVSCSPSGFSGVGGDCYDVFLLDKKHLGLMVFDVSGHGIPAAMISSNAKLTFARCFDNVTSLPKVFENFVTSMRKVYPNSKSEEYLTALLAVIDTETLDISYCRAAHEFPFIYRSGARRVEKLDSAGGRLGFDPDLSFDWVEGRAKLERGDYFVLFTDGLIDGFGRDGKVGIRHEIYGINSLDFSSSSDLIAHFLKIKQDFVIKPVDDDITCLVVGVKK